MYLPILNLNKYTIMDQIDKIKEELNEFEHDVRTNMENDWNVYAEYFDLLQSVLGIMQKLDEEKTKKYCYKHFKKLFKRNWEIEGVIKIHYE